MDKKEIERLKKIEWEIKHNIVPSHGDAEWMTKLIRRLMEAAGVKAQ